jgi:hypothetical protein
MPTKETSDRVIERADYAAWKLAAVAELAKGHDIRAAIIPEGLWRHIYIQGRTPQDAADRAAVSAHDALSLADRLRKFLKRTAPRPG